MIVLVAAVFLVAGAIAYVAIRPDSSTDGPQAAQGAEDTLAEVAPEEGDGDIASPGRYVVYSQEAFDDASDKTRLLFFHASWCPQCRALDESIMSEQALPSEVVIYKVDYDNSQDLRQRYGVTIQTTVVRVDARGEKVASYVAYDSPSFASVEEALLE